MTATPAPGPHTWCHLGDGCTCAPLEMRGCRHAVVRTSSHARTYLPPDDVLPAHPQDTVSLAPLALALGTAFFVVIMLASFLLLLIAGPYANG